jgi:LPXTG-motif cell wall-anchored protein
MAINSTPRRRFGVALGVVLTTVTAGLIGFAGTASAHTNRTHASCEGDTTTLYVDLTSYNNRQANKVTVTDGDTVLHDGDFSVEYKHNFEVPGNVAHDFKVKAVAWDDPNNQKGWSPTTEIHVNACVVEEQPPTTTTTTSTTEETTTTTTTSEEQPSTTTEAPPVASSTPVTTTTTAEVKEEALAETGASIALPLGIAGVLLVGGVVALFVVRRRGKA